MVEIKSERGLERGNVIKSREWHVQVSLMLATSLTRTRLSRTFRVPCLVTSRVDKKSSAVPKAPIKSSFSLLIFHVASRGRHIRQHTWLLSACKCVTHPPFTRWVLEFSYLVGSKPVQTYLKI